MIPISSHIEIEHRRKDLEYYIQQIISSPEYSDSYSWKRFIKEPNELLC